MGRAPCCEKTGLKKGPWTKQEDLILITHIIHHGHDNWRALPKKAGLLRCGKSCRLRWTNYLKPDIKRGNFSKEEEDTIIHLHQVLGNRWSVIAARLPGRTDNEIKNVWHTNLKKKLDKQAIPAETQKKQITETESLISPEISGSAHNCSPPHSSSLSGDVSSSITTVAEPENAGEMCVISDDCDLQSYDLNLDEDFWLDGVVSSEDSGKFSGEDEISLLDYSGSFNSNINSTSEHDDGVDFWSDLFMRAEELLQLPEF